MSYAGKLNEAMEWLAEQEGTVFLGQSMECGGIAIANSFSGISPDKRMEMPVAENLQMGISIGLAIEGFVPVSVYPRWNFLLLASDQLVNHLDKLSSMTGGAYKPKVIIRVAVGVRKPVDPQEQHVGDFTNAFKSMLGNVDVVRLTREEDIMDAYKFAYNREDGVSTILVEEHQF